MQHVECESNWTGDQSVKDSRSAYVKIKMALNLSDVWWKFIVVSCERLNCHCRRCEGNVSTSSAFNRVVRCQGDV